MIQPKLIHLLLCESVGRGPDGRRTLYGLIDRVVRPAFPARLERCAVFGRFGYGDGGFEARFVVRGPDGEAVYDPGSTCPFELSDPLATADVVLTIEELELPAPGSYWIETHLGESVLPNSLPFYVDHR